MVQHQTTPKIVAPLSGASNTNLSHNKAKSTLGIPTEHGRSRSKSNAELDRFENNSKSSLDGKRLSTTSKSREPTTQAKTLTPGIGTRPRASSFNALTANRKSSADLTGLSTACVRSSRSRAGSTTSQPLSPFTSEHHIGGSSKVRTSVTSVSKGDKPKDNVAVLKEQFRNYAKHRGWIDALGLRALCYDLGYYLDDENLKLALKFLDPGTGRIEFDEFYMWWTEKRFEKRFDFAIFGEDEALAILARSFQNYDSDGNGIIDREEFTKFHQDLVKRGLMKVSLEECLKALDSNGDGQMSFNEYVDFILQRELESRYNETHVEEGKEDSEEEESEESDLETDDDFDDGVDGVEKGVQRIQVSTVED